MVTHKPKNILIAPLDWGLGHTTRCVPLIRYIQGLGHKVFVAGNEWQRSFIREIFDHISIIDLGGYDVTYSKWNQWGQVGVLSQIPRLNKTIRAEHQWLKQKANELQLHGIISDNRYGLFHTDIPSVIMTHQLCVRTGMGNFIDRSVQKIHYKHLDRFDTTWVVDVPMGSGLGGALSHPPELPSRSVYIGLLSQFAGNVAAGNNDGTLLILLSGPEPQRSELSHILWQQVQHYEGKVVFVEGTNNVTPPPVMPPHIIYHKRLANEKLAPLLQSAGIVICRSGYSTLMDLVALRKKAIIIPTPGQTEQEYLGAYLHKAGIFYTVKQKGFEISRVLKISQQFPYHSLPVKGEYSRYEQVIDNWLETL